MLTALSNDKAGNCASIHKAVLFLGTVNLHQSLVFSRVISDEK